MRQSDTPGLGLAVLDPDKGADIFACGRKGTGKSELCWRFFSGFPHDRLVLDVTGDVRPRLADEGIPVAILDQQAMPLRFPAPPEGEARATALIVPDVAAPAWQDDVDRAVGLALRKGRCLVWYDEFGELTSGNVTPPNTRRLLHQGRHRKMSALMCCPRPVDVNKLGPGQADAHAIFDLPDGDDRKRMAKVMGYDSGLIDSLNTEVQQVHGKHGFLWNDVDAHELSVMPPLPPRTRGSLYPQVPA